MISLTRENSTLFSNKKKKYVVFFKVKGKSVSIVKKEETVRGF